MAVKNVGSSPVTSPGLGKAKDSDESKKAMSSQLGVVGAGSQSPASANIGNKDFGVQLSDKARARVGEQKKAFEIAKATPDVREDRVAAIKAKLQAGTYEIDSGKIADGMLREAIMEHLATDKDS